MLPRNIKFNNFCYHTIFLPSTSWSLINYLAYALEEFNDCVESWVLVVEAITLRSLQSFEGRQTYNNAFNLFQQIQTHTSPQIYINVCINVYMYVLSVYIRLVADFRFPCVLAAGGFIVSLASVSTKIMAHFSMHFSISFQHVVMRDTNQDANPECESGKPSAHECSWNEFLLCQPLPRPEDIAS